MELLDAMTRAEIERARADYKAWKAGDHGALDKLRFDAITAVLDVTFDNKPALAARGWSFFRHLFAQRETLPTAQRDAIQLGRLLQKADACAWDSYLLFPRGEVIAPPIVCLDLIDSPQTYLRAQLRAQTRALQIPLAFIPPRFLSSPWLLTTLHHEVGHTIDVDLGLSSRVHDLISRKIPDPLRPQWSQWAREMVCDALAIAVNGPAFVWSLASVFEALDQWNSWEITRSVHPPAELRIVICVALAERLGWNTSGLDRLVEEVDVVNGPPAVPPLLACVDAVADCVVSALPMPREPTDQGQLSDAAARLVRGETVKGLPIRIVPAAAQLALIESTTGETLKAIDSCFEEAQLPTWVPPQEAWKQLADLVARTAPPDGLETGRKVPPAKLLERHERISFVGATNHQLFTSLAQAFDRRAKRKYTELEVFFSSDAVLARIDGSLVERKNTAIAQLSESLTGWTDAWRLYESDEPYYFASYWDVGSESTAARIHVSPYVWGQDFGECPAIDYLHNGDPSRAFRIYEKGLTALRARARLIASSTKGA